MSILQSVGCPTTAVPLRSTTITAHARSQMRVNSALHQIRPRQPRLISVLAWSNSQERCYLLLAARMGMLLCQGRPLDQGEGKGPGRPQARVQGDRKQGSRATARFAATIRGLA